MKPHESARRAWSASAHLPAIPCFLLFAAMAAGCGAMKGLVGGEGGFAAGCTDQLRLVYEPQVADPQQVYVKTISAEFPKPRDGMTTDGGSVERWTAALVPLDFVMPHMVVCRDDKVKIVLGREGAWPLDLVANEKDSKNPAVTAEFLPGQEKAPGQWRFHVKTVPGYTEQPPPPPKTSSAESLEPVPVTVSLPKNCNLREEPNTRAASVVLVPARGQVVVSERHGNWYRVEYGGMQGWMSVDCFGRK